VFLIRERAVLEQSMPGLDTKLVAVGIEALERRGSPGIELWRDAGGPGMMIPRNEGGGGTSAADAMKIQLALGSRTPSLAVATTMHHFSIATLLAVPEQAGVRGNLFAKVATGRRIVASGFAEGTGNGILSPIMTGRTYRSSVIVSGRKRPCSLAESMDLLTFSVEHEGQLAIALVPANLPGISRKPFWRNDALAGAQSDEIVLDEVRVPRSMFSYSGEPGELGGVERTGLVWFELLITAAYTGAVAGLVELALQHERAPASEVIRCISGIEMAASALDGLAHRLDESVQGTDLLRDALTVRYGIQDALDGIARLAAEVCGGTMFASSNTITSLLSAGRALAFHPPSRHVMSTPLVSFVRGQSASLHLPS
jgi:alkylation response protein AidB-like acyl-CoA dehydrogenase